MEISTALLKIDTSRKQAISKSKDMGNNIFDYQANHKILHPYSEKDVCFILEICSKSSIPDVKYATNMRDVLLSGCFCSEACLGDSVMLLSVSELVSSYCWVGVHY